MTNSLILSARLVAIIRLDDLSAAAEIAEALFEGGIRAIEFTLTNADSPKMVRRLLQDNSLLRAGVATIGIGSVRSVDEAKESIDAGAQFLVTPITSIPIIEYCRDRSVPVCAGAFTPTEIANAWQAGADIVKVFPARTLGPDYIRDVLAPMPYLKLMPTGGIDLQNMRAYFRAGASSVGIGSQLLDRQALQERNWRSIAEMASQYATAAEQGAKP